MNTTTKRAGPPAPPLGRGRQGEVFLRTTCVWPSRPCDSAPLAEEAPRIGRKRAAWLALLWAIVCVAHAGGTSETTWTESERADGYVVCSRSTLQPYFAQDVPEHGEVIQSVGCTLARREYEPLIVGVHAIDGPLDNVRIAVKADLSIRVHRVLPNRRNVAGRGEADIPWYLPRSDHIAHVEADRTGVFWLVVHADENARPGTHRGSIVITADGRPATTVGLVVNVRPITLPRPCIAFGMYYDLARNPKGLADAAHERMYFRDMAEHGMTTCTVYASAEFTQDTARRTGLIRYADWSAPRQLRLMKEAGLVHADIPAMLLDGRVLEAANRAGVAADLRAFCRANEYPELLLYGHDEPGWRHFDELTAFLTPWKRVADMRLVTAMNCQPPYGVGYLHDVWVVRNDEITRELVAEAGRLGADVWTYAIDLGCANPLANRYYAGLYTWAFGLGGNSPWAYIDTPAAFLTDDGVPSTWPSLGFVLPSGGGPIPSVGWEGRREGVDDYRYLQLLETMLAAAPTTDPTVVEARTWLAGWRARVDWDFYGGATVGDRTSMDLHDPAPHIPVPEYDALREQATRYIVKLPAPAGAPLPPAVHRVPPALAGRYEPAAYQSESIDTCVAALSSPDVGARRAAARSRSLRGRAAAPAVGRLAELLADPDVRPVAFRALEVIGPAAAPAIPALARQLAHRDPWIRVGATFALTGIGREAVPVLARAIDDEAWYVAVLAMQKTGQAGPDAAPLVRVLADQLQQSNNDRVTWAAAALRDVGPAAVEVLPDLIAALRASPSLNARWWSAEALGKLGDAALPALPALAAAAREGKPHLRDQARVALFRITGEQMHLEELMSTFADAPTHARRRTAALLQSLGPAAAPVAEELRSVREGEADAVVRRHLDALLALL